MLPAGTTGAEADLWRERTGNVLRALTFVPDEVRALQDLGAARYLQRPDDGSARAGSLDARTDRARRRPGLGAARVFLLNQLPLPAAPGERRGGWTQRCRVGGRTTRTARAGFRTAPRSRVAEALVQGDERRAQRARPVEAVIGPEGLVDAAAVRRTSSA